MEITLTIFQILGITGGSGLFSAIVISLIDHFFIKSRELRAKQWEIKKDACLGALSVIDSYFSNIDWKNENGGKIEGIQKQSSQINEAREAQSKLILTCKDTTIVNKFNEILFSKDSKKSRTILLDEFRNLLRKELGFGNNLDLDKEKSWYGKIDGMIEK